MSEPNTLPRHTDIVAASVNEHRVAIAVFEHAQRTGERITLGVVERYLDEFRSHEPSCECGLCAAASRVRASGVWVRRERVGRPGRGRGHQAACGALGRSTLRFRTFPNTDTHIPKIGLGR